MLGGIDMTKEELMRKAIELSVQNVAECTFRRMEIPEVNRTEYDMTAMFMEQLEQMIRKAPQYWLWTHKRWKRTKEEWLRRQQDSTIK